MARFATLSGSYAANDVNDRAQVLDPGLADTLTALLWTSAVGGTLHIEQSVDGTNWDLDTTFAATAGTGTSISVSIVAPFVRVRFTNGANAATVRCSVRFASAGPR